MNYLLDVLILLRDKFSVKLSKSGVSHNLGAWDLTVDP
jgi:hypothetical protein